MRKRYDASFKARIALEAIRGGIRGEFGGHNTDFTADTLSRHSIAL